MVMLTDAHAAFPVDARLAYAAPAG